MHRTAQKQSRGYEIVSNGLHDESGAASEHIAPILPIHRVPASSGARALDVRPRLRSSAEDQDVPFATSARGPGDAMEILQGMYTAYRAQGAYSPEQLGRVRC